MRILVCEGIRTFALVLWQVDRGGWDEYGRVGIMGGISNEWFNDGYDMKVKII
jgi:hypothetical protein